MQPSSNDELIEVVNFIVDKFRAERLAYLIIVGCSAILLLGLAMYMLVDNRAGNIEEVLGMFGSTGVMALSFSRILRIWDDCFKFISEHFKQSPSS